MFGGVSKINSQGWYIGKSCNVLSGPTWSLHLSINCYDMNEFIRTLPMMHVHKLFSVKLTEIPFHST